MPYSGETSLVFGGSNHGYSPPVLSFWIYSFLLQHFLHCVLEVSYESPLFVKDSELIKGWGHVLVNLHFLISIPWYIPNYKYSKIVLKMLNSTQSTQKIVLKIRNSPQRHKLISINVSEMIPTKPELCFLILIKYNPLGAGEIAWR